MVAFGSLTTLGGYVGAGKTPLALRLARAVMRGEPFLGQPATVFPGAVRVAYLTEEPHYTFDQAVRDARLSEQDNFAAFYWDENANVRYERAVRDAAAWAMDGPEGGVLFVDTAFFWSGISDMGAENDPGKMNEVYRPLVKETARGCAVWVHAHTVKTFDRVPDEEADIAHIRGSGAVVSNSTVILLYKKLAKDPTSDTRFLRVGRTRIGLGGMASDQYVTLRGGELEVTSLLNVKMQEMDKLVERVVQMVKDAGDDATTQELKDAWAGDAQQLTGGLKLAVSEGRLGRSGRGVKGDPYVYRTP